MTTTTMAMGDNNVDVDGAMDDKVKDDGDGTMGDYDDNDDDGDATGNGVTGYDDDDCG